MSKLNVRLLMKKAGNFIPKVLLFISKITLAEILKQLIIKAFENK